MKKFLTILTVLVIAIGTGFAANPPMPATATVTFVYKATQPNVKTIAGFYKSPVTTYENLILEPAQINTNLEYNTHFGGVSQDKVYATIGTNWASKAADVGSSAPTLSVKLTMNPFKRDNVEEYKGYTVNYRVVARAGAISGLPSDGNDLTFNPSGSSKTNTQTGVDLSVITVGKQENTVVGDFMTITSKVGAFIANPSGNPDQQGFLEIEFSNMQILNEEIEVPSYKPVESYVDASNITYKATWVLEITAA